MTKAPLTAFDAAVGYLARRMHSRSELKSKLFRKGFPGQEIYRALDRLQELGYVDDRKFASDFARYRLRRSPRGEKLLRGELLQRGVSREIVEDALAEVFEEVQEDGLVAELVGKWQRSRGDAYDSNDVAKLARSLARKGFDWNTIRRRIDALVSDDSSEDYSNQ